MNVEVALNSGQTPDRRRSEILKFEIPILFFKIYGSN